MNDKTTYKYQIGDFVQVKHDNISIHDKWRGKIGKVEYVTEHTADVNIGGEVRTFYYTDFYDGVKRTKDKETDYHLDRIKTMRNVLVDKIRYDTTRAAVYDEIIADLESKPECGVK